MNNNRDKIYEIIVAHYNEDIDRLRPYADHVIIYHKWNETEPRFPVKKRIKLENVGREWHTYLYHIINNYDNLADYTAFLQWSISDHADNNIAYDKIDDYLQEIKKYWFSTKTLWLMKKRDPQIIWLGKFQDMIAQWTLIRSSLSFSEFYHDIFWQQQPIVIPVFYWANFAVSKEKIIGRSREFYQKIYHYMGSSSNPEEWHYLERLRFQIFNKTLSFWVLKKITKDIVRYIIKW